MKVFNITFDEPERDLLLHVVQSVSLGRAMRGEIDQNLVNLIKKIRQANEGWLPETPNSWEPV